MKFSGANGTNCPVVGGPGNLKQVGLLVYHALFAWFEGLHGNNVTALKLRPTVEAAPDFGNIFNQCPFSEEMARAINPRDFNTDTYWQALFPSLLVIDRDWLGA